MLINIQNIKKTYGTGEALVNAVNGISFTIGEKDFVSVCGPSGSGKSTLLTMMAGLNQPDSGEVIVDDLSIYKELNQDGLASFRNEYIGFVFQSFQLLKYLSALENVMLPLACQKMTKKEKTDLARQALEKVELKHKAKYLPGELSGGQQQRVAIARALVNKPLIILADEPTGNLDSNTRDEILNLFHSLKESGHTIIMVTHDPENIKNTNRVIRVRDGVLDN